jgi:ABC-type transport system involved in multi-copper enzyme maturation permease subunit
MSGPPRARTILALDSQPVANPPARPREWRSLWLIAQRGALESLHDRMTLVLSLFFALIFPAFMVLTIIRSQVAVAVASGEAAAVGKTLAIYVLTIGLLPTSGAIGVACGQFAGEKEQGSLAPLLASPASNGAIFGGKILGSILPTMLFSVIAEGVYLGGLALVSGADKLRLLPVALSLTMLALVPAVAIFTAAVASLISSRVRTFNSAQQLAGIVLLPFWALVFGLMLKLQDWGIGGLLAVVAGLFALDVALTALAAVTWRREEVLANR